ncbi:DUF2339 domain-containing protein [Yeosuana sp.]|uniref:DUF2339 domain-containing protein n=1 Tax=Yeosuana sp. TaxID=2529388 RepID=UPI004054D2CE
MDDQKVNDLQNKLDLLLKKQESFSKEVIELQKELNQLKASGNSPQNEKESIITNLVLEEKSTIITKTPKGFYRDINHRGIGGVCSGLGLYFGINRYLVRLLWLILTLFFGIGFFLYIILWIAVPKTKKEISYQKPVQSKSNEPPKQETTSQPVQKSIKISNELEKFIGENLINKIGIAILIIGVAIGAKYSIENDLISPLTRIILGYLVGLGLLGVSMKLKTKYENFSAVLVGGALAIFYFLTYAAYDYYELIPQLLTFALMFIFTVFTVFVALQYNKQLIAHIGLVGAYAVPFLLSDGSGHAEVLFSYVAIINIGILVLAFKKYWKPLNYVSFALTWLIFFSWHASNYESSVDFIMALTFASVFFIIFYISFLAYKLIKKEPFERTDILLLLANSFVFYGLGYSILNDHETGSQLLGLFTICNAILHFIVSVVIYRLKLADKNLFYLVAGLVLVFITIAIPVQLDGNWVTLLWVGEAALLFWIGRSKNIAVYESISYPLMALATLSLYQDWADGYFDVYLYDGASKMMPFLNIHFLSSVLFIAAFGFIFFIHNNTTFVSPISQKNDILKIVSFTVPAIIITTLYFSFLLEIEHYFQSLFKDSELIMNDYPIHDYDILTFKTIWLIIYSMVFVSILSFINIKKIKNKTLGYINIGLNVFAVFMFLIVGLYALSELRESYLNQSNSEYYNIGALNIGVRYISYAFLAITLYVTYTYICEVFMKINNKINFSILFYVAILWIVSSELINILDLSGSTQSYKLGLTILWGIYSLVLIALGIWKKQKHIRISAIVLFSITLLKLFFYDISDLGTLSKTIVFVSLGILLLIISFLYNKFKHNISDDTEV